MEVRRIGPDGSAADWLRNLENRIRSLETSPAGAIVIRQTLTTTDPATGVSTIIGELPDGSFGVQPFIGDTTPPPVATIARVSAQPGVFTITWDGEFVAGAPKPRDFQHVNILGRKVVSGVPEAPLQIGVIRLPSEQVFVSTDVAALGERWRFTLQSEDYNGNKAAEGQPSDDTLMESLVGDQGISDAIQGLIQEDVDLNIRADTAQADLTKAQALADALLAAGVDLTVNGDFELPIVNPPTGWPVRTLTYVEANAGARSGANLLRAAPTSTTAYAYTDLVSAVKDRTYYSEMWVKLSSAATTPSGTIGFYFTTTKLDGSSNVDFKYNIEGLTAADLSTTTYTKVTAKYPVAIDVTKIRFGPRLTGTGNVYLIDGFKAMDITEAAAAQLKADQAFNLATDAAVDAGNAQTTADTKNRNWYQDNPPAGVDHKDGDQWFDTNDGNKLYLWKGAPTNAWIGFQDTAIAAAAQTATGAQSTADLKNTSYYVPTAPANSPVGTLKAGDLWFDTDDSYRLSTWSGSAWQTTQDAALAKLTADAKGRTYTQNTVPGIEARSDKNIWIDTSLGLNQSVTKYWDATANAGAGAWVPVADKGIKDAKDTADLKSETIYSSTAPDASKQLVQNLWIDTSGGINLNKRWDAVNGWTVVADKRIGDNTTNLANLTATVSAVSGTADAAQLSANGKNKVHYSTSVASGTTDPTDGNRPYVNGDTWFRKDASNVVIGQWEFLSGAWVSKKIDGIVIANIDAGTITVGDLDAARITSRSISVDKLLVEATDNLISEPSFLAAGAAWVVGGAYSIDPTGSRSGGPAWKIVNAASQQGAYNKPVELVLEGGTSYRMSAYLKCSVAIPASGITLYARSKDAAGAYTYSTVNISAVAANTWVRLSGILDIPVGTLTVSFGIFSQTNLSTGNLWIDYVSATRAGTGELIVDGAIDGKTITGPTIQTEATASRGIKLTSTELAGYDGAGVKNFSLATDGTLTIRGAIQSGSTITGATLTGTGIQTSGTALTGVKISSSGILAYDSSNNMTFKVDAATGLVEAPGLKANSITGDKIAADTISAKNIAIGDFTNVAYGGEFNDAADLVNWTLPAGVTYTTTLPQAGVGCLAVAASGSVRTVLLTSSVAVRPGDQFNIEFWYKTTSDANGTSSNSKFRIGDQANSILTSIAFDPVQTSWTKLTGSYTVPASGVTDLQLNIMFNHSVGTVWFDSLVMRKRVGATLIEDGSITTAKVISSGIDAGAITAGTVTALQMKGKSITVDKLLVSSTDNLIQEAGFDALGLSWELPAGFAINATAGRNSLPAMVITNAASLQTSFNAVGNPTKVAIESSSNAENSYRISTWVKSTVSVPVSGAYVSARFRSTTGTYTTISMPYTTPGTSTPATMPTAGTWYEISGMVTAPANTISVAFSLSSAAALSTGTLTWDTVSVTRASNGELIVDGSIKTQHMTSGTIDAGVLTAGSIRAPQISSKGITVDKLIITSTDNLIVEADFSNNGTSWTTGANNSVNATAGRGSMPAMRFTGTVSAINITNLVNKVSIDSNSRFRGSIWVKSNAALAAGKILLIARCYTTVSAYTDVTIASNALLVVNTWTNIVGHQSVTPSVAVPALPANTIAVEFILQVTNNATGTVTDIDSVSATRAADGSLVVDGTITALKLETDMVLATTIVAGDPSGTHAEMSPTGFRVYADDPIDGIPNEVIRLGVASTNDFFAVTKSDGTLATTISQDGVISVDKVYANSEIYYKGYELQNQLDMSTRGLKAYGLINQDISFATTEYGMFDVSFEADATRAYRVSVKAMATTSDATGIKWRVRSAVTTRPTITSYLQRDHEGIGSASQWLANDFSFVTYPSYQSTGTWMERFLLTGQKMGSGTAVFKNGEVTIEDIGPRIWAAAGINNGGGSPAAAAQQYTKQYQSNNSRSYTGSNADYPFNTDKMFQGLSPSGYGNLKSLALFPDMTADLSGATISSMKVLFYFDHWYNNSGGTAYVGVHGFTSIPGTFSDGGNIITSTGWPKPGGRWLDIPSNWWSAFASGSARGVSLVGDSTYNSYGYAGRPIIEITYSK